MSFCFIHNRTAAMRPLSIKRASKTDQVTVLAVYQQHIITLLDVLLITKYITDGKDTDVVRVF